MLDQTKIKRTIIIIIYFILFISFAFLLYFLIKPDPTCYDGKKNQYEKGIDCGGPCKPCEKGIDAEDLVIDKTYFLSGGNNTYDLVAKISNPNYDLGAKKFQYAFALKDSYGRIISTREGSSYIFPGDSRYIIELGLVTENNLMPSEAEIKISEVEWKNALGEAKPKIDTIDKKFGKASVGDGYEAKGLMRNESGFDLERIDIAIILKDANGDIVGINKTFKDSLRIKEEREFLFSWPYPLENEVETMEVYPESNVL